MHLNRGLVKSNVFHQILILHAYTGYCILQLLRPVLPFLVLPCNVFDMLMHIAAFTGVLTCSFHWFFGGFVNHWLTLSCSILSRSNLYLIHSSLYDHFYLLGWYPVWIYIYIVFILRSKNFMHILLFMYINLPLIHFLFSIIFL